MNEETQANVSVKVTSKGVHIQGSMTGYELAEVLRTAEETFRAQKARQLKNDALVVMARCQAAWPIVAMLWLMFLVACFWPQPQPTVQYQSLGETHESY